jgi:hypothetical protein
MADVLQMLNNEWLLKSNQDLTHVGFSETSRDQNRPTIRKSRLTATVKITDDCASGCKSMEFLKIREA